MAPKQTAAAKQALILAWFQKSGVAHSIKDLEKALPSISSINGMQVKDYLQALSDDNKIRVEKIGSGNWYWSFPSEETKARESLFEKAQEDCDKATVIVRELQVKVEEAGAAREDDDDMLLGSGNDRTTLTTKHSELSRELESLQQELARYSENDPVEMGLRKLESQNCRIEAEKWTEQIHSMEDWLKENTGGDKGQMLNIMRMYYGEEFDEEDGCLREI